MKKYAKQTALALAMALTVTSVAPATASAASAPKYKKEYNTVKKGKSYAYTVKNIKKGTKVKWSLVGTGKKYVSFNKSKAVYSETTKAAKKKTYSTNKIYIRKNTSKVVKVVVKASVTGKNGKKYSVTDKIAIAKTATKPTATPATTASTTPSTAPSTTPAATATGAATATPSVAPTATSAATATPSVAPSASTTPSTAPTATASTKPSATPAATATTKPSAAPVVTNGAITVTSNATGASVKVLNGTTVVATGTIANGKAVLPKVANGNYVVEVSATGFITATKAVVVNGDVTVDVQLEASKEFTAKQIGRQKILVTGTNLSDKVADYTVKRGNASVAIDKVEVDKTTATLTTVSSTLTAGDYTVELGTQKYAFKAADEKLTKLEIIGTNLVLASENATEATIGFKASNQFDEKMAVTTINEKSVTTTLGKVEKVTAPSRTANGEIKITDLKTNVTPIGTKATIVVVEQSAGLTASATVTLSAAAAIDSVKVAGIYKDYTDSVKATKVDTLETDADLSKYALLIKAYDQYGNENLKACTPGGVNITASSATNVTVNWTDKDYVTDKYITKIGEETYVAIPFKKSSDVDVSKGTVTISIIGLRKGLLNTTTIDVKQSVKVESIKLSLDGNTLYSGTETEIAYVAKDTNGNEVTDFNKLNKELKTTGAEEDRAFQTVSGEFKWKRQKDGSAKLYFTPKVSEDSFGSNSDTSSTTITVTVRIGNSIDVPQFTVYKKKMVNAIVGIDKEAALATVVSNGAVTLKAENIIFQDQYGNVLTDDEVAGLHPTIQVSLDGDRKGFEKVSAGEVDNVSAEVAGVVNVGEKGKNTVVVNAEAAKPVGNKAAEAGKTRVKVALVKFNKEANEYEEMKSSDYTFTIQSVGIDDISEITVADLGQFYVKKDATGNVVSGNAVELKVTGKLGSTTVALTKDDYTIIGTSFKQDATGKIGFNTGKLILVDPTNPDSNKTSKTETLEIVINNKVGTSIKKDVTVSSIDPKAATVALADSKTELVLDKKVGTKITAADIRELLEVKDQYGIVDKKGEDGKYSYNFGARYQFETSNLPEGFAVEKNNTNEAGLTVASKAGTYTVGVTVTFDSGVSYTDTLIINVTNPTSAE